MHPLFRVPYAALGAAAELAVALSPRDSASPSKWRRALTARHGLSTRLRVFARQRDPSRPLVWFHAASVGEALMALPVLHGLRAKVPNAQTAFTWFSPSAEAFASRFDADYRDYLPFDTPKRMREALDALNPTALVYAKLDVWPVLTELASARGVRVGLIAAALSGESGRRGFWARALLADAYAQLEVVGAASVEDADRLVALGARRDAVVVTGDTRYDQAWDRARRVDPTRAPISVLTSDRPTVVAGSTWPADEAVLTSAWERLRRRVPSARLIVAPHEPTAGHLGPLRSWGARVGLATALESEPAASGADLVIVDRVGVLADLYALATAAMVGGGFHSFGLHSVLEPAALGVPVAFGPNWRTSRDATGLLAAGGASAAAGPAELADTLGLWLTTPSARAVAGAAAAGFVESGLGAAARSVELVERLLR